MGEAFTLEALPLEPLICKFHTGRILACTDVDPLLDGLSITKVFFVK